MVAPEKHVLFGYSPKHDAAAVDKLLSGFSGKLVADAHSVFNHLYESGDVVECGCWAHTRRYLFKSLSSDAVRANHALEREELPDELEGMDDWTRNLSEWFQEIPDAVAIRVEFLARQDRHQEAVKELLGIIRRGVPWFRSGVGYLESRSRLYASAAARAQSRLLVDDDTRKTLEKLAKTFGELASALDMSRATTVLRGMNRLT